jgi:hypothetical protein
MRAPFLIFLAALAGCATTADMAAKPASAVYHSHNARAAVADCLLNRVSDTDMWPERKVGPDVTTIGFTARDSATHTGIYLFTIRDEGTGSVTEARRFAHAPLSYAETCF